MLRDCMPSTTDTGLRRVRRVRRVGLRVLAAAETEATLSVPQTDAVASEGDGVSRCAQGGEIFSGLV